MIKIKSHGNKRLRTVGRMSIVEVRNGVARTLKQRYMDTEEARERDRKLLAKLKKLRWNDANRGTPKEKEEKVIFA